MTRSDPRMALYAFAASFLPLLPLAYNPAYAIYLLVGWLLVISFVLHQVLCLVALVRREVTFAYAGLLIFIAGHIAAALYLGGATHWPKELLLEIISVAATWICVAWRFKSR